MSLPHGIPYDELAMFQKEANEDIEELDEDEEDWMNASLGSPKDEDK